MLEALFYIGIGALGTLAIIGTIEGISYLVTKCKAMIKANKQKIKQ